MRQVLQNNGYCVEICRGWGSAVGAVRRYEALGENRVKYEEILEAEARGMGEMNGVYPASEKEKLAAIVFENRNYLTCNEPSEGDVVAAFRELAQDNGEGSVQLVPVRSFLQTRLMVTANRLDDLINNNGWVGAWLEYVRALQEVKILQQQTFCESCKNRNIGRKGGAQERSVHGSTRASEHRTDAPRADFYSFFIPFRLSMFFLKIFHISTFAEGLICSRNHWRWADEVAAVADPGRSGGHYHCKSRLNGRRGGNTEGAQRMTLVFGSGDGGCDRRGMIKRMHGDPILWIETNLKIRRKDGELVPFILNAFQRKLVNAVMESVREEGDAFFVVLKGRQLGISSICRALMLWRALNYVGQQCVFSAHTEPDTKRSMTTMREMLATMNRLYGYPTPSMESDSRILWRNSGSAIRPSAKAKIWENFLKKHAKFE
jgi:hypothetical protein